MVSVLLFTVPLLAKWLSGGEFLALFASTTGIKRSAFATSCPEITTALMAQYLGKSTFVLSF